MVERQRAYLLSAPELELCAWPARNDSEEAGNLETPNIVLNSNLCRT